ncbi:BTAD domain-containing putative transcriptional regulator [Streptomyces sp. LHD-70]|uniref:AfsR/SARP family transcriptional regulator n=1 Tax=Streptomyces sp. LHD-70 TaxID=3072140 RepID=UPI00280DEBFF|nr:BTAD domain-containing putative transcriptional regulator [Streptomyces sp. LHD-70]MDQ8706933.1 BTAD domain-containing putative transcriptional regulator [Streptomyces sp. LHD-70]
MQRTPVEAGTPMGSAPGRQGLRIGVLGPLELHHGRADRTPTAPMTRRLLAVLLLHANRAVPVTALVDELWDGTAPRSARQAVQTYVYQLRRALGEPPDTAGAVIETRPGGYLLRLRPEQLDLWAFQSAVSRARRAQEQGDDATAAERLRAALDLWRGPAFAGIEAGPLLAARIAQLDDARLGALELRIAADLRLGRHRGVLGELMGLALAHPRNEEFTAQLMTAAYRAGRRGTALDAFRRLRRNLVDELGIEPSQRLSTLHQDVLTQAPGLDLPVRGAVSVPVPVPVPVPGAVGPVSGVPAAGLGSPAPAPAPGSAGIGAGTGEPVSGAAGPGLDLPSAAAGQGLDLPVPGSGRAVEVPAAGCCGRVPPAHLPADTADFTGRTDELRRVLDLGRAGCAGAAPTVIALNGTAGAGKTTLAVHAAHALKDRFPDGQLYAVLHDTDDRPLAPADVLHALLHGTGMRPEDIPGTADGRARAFRTWSAERALLILLDDAAGAEQVLPLLPGSGSSTVLITSRVRLGGLPGARLLGLGPMAAADAARLLTEVADRTDDFAGDEATEGEAIEDQAIGSEAIGSEAEAVARVVRLCGLLPLAVRAAGEKLAARRMWTTAGFAARLADEHVRLAELRSDVFDIRARLQHALHRLPAADRHSLRLLAASGPGAFAPHTAAQTLGETGSGTERVLGALLDQHALEVVGPRHAVRFRIPELLRLTALATDGAGTPGRGLAAVPDDRSAAGLPPVQAPGPPHAGWRGSRAAARSRAFARA